jgi:hypothetical protein
VPVTCPDCSRAASLRITLSIELPPDSRSDEIALQIVECSTCGFAGIAVYEESRRGPLDRETWDHTGYRLPKTELRDLRKTMRSCPDPTNPRCACPAHRWLSQTGASGRWNTLQNLPTTDAFPISK